MGAAVSPGLGNFYGHALLAPPARYTKFQLRDASQYFGTLAVALNVRGHRFADENAGQEDELNQHLAQQPGAKGVYIIDDARIDFPPLPHSESTPRTMLARARSLGASVIEAASLEELCKSLDPMGFPWQPALRTLQEYNAAMTSGGFDLIYPRRSRYREPLIKPPFRAVVVQAGITFTMGGLAIDERGRVLSRAGSSSLFSTPPVERAYVELDDGVQALGDDYRQMPIRGLYAAGNDAGNVSHFRYMGGLASALTIGRAAGKDAARFVNKTA
jgi:hypothetical protein